jgi:hypothetical protein
VTSIPGHERPFALDGLVNADKLRELLAVQTELPWLDLKRECDLSDTRARIEFAKDVGAMQAAGGYLLVGVEDDGTVVGLPAGQARLFDEATVRAKLDKFLGEGYEVRCQVHPVETDAGPVEVAIVWVAPHPDGFNVFKAVGNYPRADGKQETVFRRGDVFARHGTRSEPWNQADLAAGNARRDALAEDRWRAKSAEDFARTLHAATTARSVIDDPSASYTWKLDAEGFEAATVELMRRDDDVPVRRMLKDARAEVARIVLEPVGRVGEVAGPGAEGRGPAALDEVVTVLDRLTMVAALALELDRPKYFTLAVQAFAQLYGWSVTDLRVQTSAHGLAPLLQLRIAERLYALGGMGVRLDRWVQVRELAGLDVAGLDEFGVGRTWHRDALTTGGRAKLFDVTREDGRTYEASLLQLANGVAARMPVLRPDLPEPDPRAPRDPMLLSICAFDLLAAVVASVRADAKDSDDVFYVSYPNFARFSGHYDKVVGPLVADERVRSELVGDVSDVVLARVLKVVDGAARKVEQRYFGWDGFRDEDVKEFIAKNAT